MVRRFLNADDDLVYKMAEGLDCKIAFFSMDEESPRIHQHIAQGGSGGSLREWIH
jgi:cyanophycin synthetase